MQYRSADIVQVSGSRGAVSQSVAVAGITGYGAGYGAGCVHLCKGLGRDGVPVSENKRSLLNHLILEVNAGVVEILA